MQKIIDCVGTVSRKSRETYVSIQSDAVEGLLGGVTKIVGGYVPFGLVTKLGLSGAKTPTPPLVEDVDDALARLYLITQKPKLTEDRIQGLRFC